MCSNKNKSDKIHIGKLIQDKVHKSGLTISEFAEKINLSRPAVYQMFNKQSIDLDLLKRISVILNENLLKHVYFEIEDTLKVKNIYKITHEPSISEKCMGFQETQEQMIQRLELIYKELIQIKEILYFKKEKV
ncbi:MAG: helix-turn-helix domain-containing protein [Bacteroidia bacterium]|nr:helix-turn-helix domain-containing protein [Bacteroidia bacterium]